MRSGERLDQYYELSIWIAESSNANRGGKKNLFRNKNEKYSCPLVIIIILRFFIMQQCVQRQLVILLNVIYKNRLNPINYLSCGSKIACSIVKFNPSIGIASTTYNIDHAIQRSKWLHCIFFKFGYYFSKQGIIIGIIISRIQPNAIKQNLQHAISDKKSLLSFRMWH